MIPLLSSLLQWIQGPEITGPQKRAALERDNCKCMVTGDTDLGKYFALTPVEQAAQGIPIPTNSCHTLPPSTKWDLELNTPDHPTVLNNFSSLLVSSMLLAGSRFLTN